MAISRRILATALFAIALILLLDTPSFGRSPSLYRHDLSSDTRRAPSLLFVAAEDAASGQTEKWEEEDEEGDDVPVAKKGGKAAGAGAGGAQQPRATWGEYLANIPWHLLRLDAAMVALVVIYYVNSFRGQSANFNLAKKWAAATLETWREQFAKIGDENGHTLMVDSARDTLFYASGRENVRKCLGYLKMLPRHDIFFFIYEAYYKGQYDKAVLEFEVPKEAVDEFVWALVNKRVSDAIVNAKTVDNRALRNDLTVARQRTHANLPKDNFLHLTESSEITDAVFGNSEFVELLKSSISEEAMRVAPGGIWIEELSISDVPREAVETTDAFEAASLRLVTLTFRIPSNTDGEVKAILNDLVRLPLILIDTICQAKGSLSTDTKAKIKKAREDLRKTFTKADEAKRLEDLRKKKLDAKNAEYAALSPRERAKREEKDAEIERKRKMKTGKQQKIVMG